MATAGLKQRVPARPDSVARVRQAVGDFAAEAGAPGDVVDDVRLAVGEACSNAVLHGAGAAEGRIDVEAGLAGQDLVVLVRDYGAGMGRRSARRGLGVGLSLIAGVCESLELRHAHPGTAVTMCFPLGAAREALAGQAGAQAERTAASASSLDA